MALAHRRNPVVGVQFHPESILTRGGYELLANFLKLANLPLPAKLPVFSMEAPREESPIGIPLPNRPVTF
jgi:hypothetical protein